MTTDLENKIVLITGGGSGIGRGTALAFADVGAKLVIADISIEGGNETVAQVRQRGGEAIFVPVNVAKADEVEAMIHQAVAHYGRLDCAFNNAGIEGLPTRTADVSEEDFDRIIAINLKGVWLCMKYQIQQMLQQASGGVIVNTASVAGLIGAHSLPAYAASKHGVVGLTRTAAVEYARKNIRVNAVCPAVIATPMVERSIELVPQLMEGIVQTNPSRRMGTVAEVAAAVLWLSSSASSFTNGATLTVDGGLTAQ